MQIKNKQNKIEKTTLGNHQIPMADLSNIDAATSKPSIIGGKAASLNQLVKWGFPVPDYCFITVDHLKQTLQLNDLHSLVSWMDSPQKKPPIKYEDIQRKILGCTISTELEQLIVKFIDGYKNVNFAVRSSGTLEDGQSTSFAGLYHTALNVKNREEIIAAIKECWLAIFSERVTEYIYQRGIQQPVGLALVIQCLVPAEKSGVLFSIDPVRGLDKEMLIEACLGLGESLVSGHVNPDQYRYNGFDRIETERKIAHKEYACFPIDTAPFTELKKLDVKRANEAVLSHKEVTELASIGLKIQYQTGFPVDIEWSKVGDQIYVLQSRPITELGFSAIEGEWTTADFRDGGVSSSVCTPYMASLYKSVMDVSMADYLKGLGLPQRKQRDIWLRCFYSRPYWNLSAVKYYLSLIPDFNEKAFDEGLGIEPLYEGEGIVSQLTLKSLLLGLRALWVIKRNCRQKLNACAEFSKQQHKRLKKLYSTPLSSLDDKKLFLLFDEFINKDYFHNESYYFSFIYDNSNLNTFFKDKVAKLGFDQNEFSYLLTGLTGVSHLAQIEQLWVIRAKILACDETSQYWKTHSIKAIFADFESGVRYSCLNELQIHLNEFGHHSRKELDLMVPRYFEEPEYVIAQIIDILNQPEKNDPRLRNKSQVKRAEQARQHLLNCVPRWRRSGLQKNLTQVRQFLWWREELRDLSTKYYFYVRQITREVANRLFKNDILQHEEDIFFLEKDLLLDLLKGELSVNSARELVAKNRMYYQCFKNYSIPDEVGSRHQVQVKDYISGPGNTRSGVSGSPGVVSGIARVIEDIDDSSRLQPGDILVTRCTDPGWTPKFAMLSGVVTETGGILSHAAVICREYGIPAVLAVKNATHQIRDGATITIDGNRGQVLLDEKH